LYLYPSDLTDELIDTIIATDVPYFDLSLQHVSKPLLRRMRRWGDGDRFLRRIADIRHRQPGAANCRTTSRPAAATTSSAPTRWCWSTNPVWAARTARPPRSTGSCRCPI